jgi:hypothetical protein
VLVASVFRILIQIEGRLDRSETFGPNVLSVVDVRGVNEPDLSAHYSDEKVEPTLRRTLNRRSGGRLLRTRYGVTLKITYSIFRIHF